MWPNLSWLGHKVGSGVGWAPTTKEGWAVTILCLAMVLVGSLVVSRLIRLLIAIGVIAALLSMGVLSGAASPG